MPQGSVDYEANNTFIEGSWRKGDGNMTSMLPLRNIPRRPSLYLHAIRNELADYFVRYKATSWQCNYA
ncbi:hypothetical protein NQ314_017911 [Rhamnusium bicolor]|uniref:Uncharacterized protein n=1 Tax=Rhamnusium bicolor TaxID=1586634 RepID=A0AAV8WSM1_9CUCU|nr:hypothetical protein NQ314_017911 [Rhamnusium bicolor]